MSAPSDRARGSTARPSAADAAAGEAVHAASGPPRLPSGFVDVLASDGLAEGAVVGVEVAGRPVALARHEGRVHALDGECPHRGGLMTHGDLDRGCLVCPLHAWRFDVRDGAAAYPVGARIATYRVAEANGRIGVAPS